MSVVLALTVIFAAPAQGQPMVLSMEDVERMALERNRTVRQAREAVAAARAALAQAKAAQRFTLAAQGKLNSHEPTASFNVPLPTGDTIKIDLIPKVSWQVGLMATQPLYHGGQLYYQELLARLGVDSAKLEKQRQEWEIRKQARELFLSVLQAQEMEKVARENVSRAARHLQDARARVEAGTAPGFDVIRAEAEVANANDGLVAAHAAVEKTMAALKTLLSIPVTRRVRLQRPAMQAIEQADLEAAIAAAMKHRPEVHAAETAVRLAKAQIGMARATRRPSVDLYASYQHTSVAGFAGHHWGWDIGVQIKQLLFDHGLSRAAEKQAAADMRKAEEAAKQIREAVALEVHQAWVDLRAAQEKIVAAEKGVRQAEEAMRIADLRYREGVAPAVEVTDARAALIAARANLVNARFAYEQAKVRLEHAIGMPLSEFLAGRTEPETAGARAEGGDKASVAEGNSSEAGAPATRAPATRPQNLDGPTERGEAPTHEAAGGAKQQAALSGLERYIGARAISAQQ